MSIKFKIVLPVALGALLAAGCNQTANNTQQNTPATTAAQPSGNSQKFSDQPYYKMSYLISDDTLSSDAKTALTGFSMGKQTLQNGDTQITLTAQKAEYHNQQYTLRPGDKLYFIEKFLGDDNTGADVDNNMGDDEAVVVDSQGNVVNQPQGWSTNSNN